MPTVVIAAPSTVKTPAALAVIVAPTPDEPLLYVLLGNAAVVAYITVGL